jgi:RNA polymerase sigma-70 factor (ECF subfamily)
MIQQEPLQISQTPDEAIIERILQGDKKAFEHIIRKYNQRLFRTGMSLLNNDADVEDAMQTAYINAYLHLGQFQNNSSFGTWFTRIMINQCLGQIRKARSTRTNIGLQANTINMVTPDSELNNKELSVLLEDAIEQLPDKYRLVFVLREVEDLTVKETAEALDIAPSNVKTRLNRAKTMLKDQLKGYMKEHVYAFHLSRCDRIVNNVLIELKIIP